ncbi:hypothetical protein OIDMADRAFT_19686 [Oidiodendron maius Zn]|uniref:Uncharacterized protein n=1 Tax=Oidiodendron maius (strain Zn) TaxID=913774 RepID=A0A0C3DC96_OIDMZ|nr:hypothetical protein OIDMADRAFT_19686 [Oidiodendron maius Zn]
MASNLSDVYSVTSFGPTVSPEFDFTPLFEDIFLSIVPSIFLLLSVPFRVFYLHRKPRKVSWSALHDHKLVCGFPFHLLSKSACQLPPSVII